MASVVPMKSLLEAGVHFGHRTRRWNPKMKPYIFTERNGIHIIDLQQTIARLNEAYEIVKETVTSNGVILFVGTKRQAQESIVTEATRCRMPYVDQRWLGGTLTNWRTIRQRIDYLVEAEKQQARGEFNRLVKKEALMREKEIARLNHRLGGLKEMRRLPNLMFVVDIRRDAIAVKEANILGIPVLAMVDTNCDPDPIDHIIPSNDDAIRAIKLMLGTMANAALDGQAILNTLEAEEEEAHGMREDEAPERYLGPSTLAKLEAVTKETEPTAEEAPAEVSEETPAVAEAETVEAPAESETEEPVAEAVVSEEAVEVTVETEPVAEASAENGATESAPEPETEAADSQSSEASEAAPEETAAEETPTEAEEPAAELEVEQKES